MALNFAVDNTGAGSFCIDHSGSGGNFTTLAAAQAAANVAGAPHTIDICPGTGPYTAQGGAMAAANYAGLTIQGTTGIAANVTVNPTGNNEVFDIRQPNITIQHLTTNNGGANGDGIETRGNNTLINNVDLQNSNRIGIFVNNATNVTISNVTISNMGREGILANAGSTGITINSAVPANPATTIDTTTRECIEIDSANADIDDVTVTNCNNMGVRIDGANASLDNIVVNTTNNVGIYLNGLAPLLNQGDTVNHTITISNTASEGIRSTNNADNAVINNITVNTTGANFECAEHQGDGDGVTVNFQNYNLSNCGREGLWMRSPNQVADTIKVDTTGSGRECMEVDGADSVVSNLDLDNCSGIGLRIDGARTSATTVDINTTGAVGLRFDGANVSVTTADITNTTGIGLLVSGNDGTVNGVNITNANNTGIRIENARADLDNIDVNNTTIHGVQITQNDADINGLVLTNIGVYLPIAASANADGITISNRRVNLTDVIINDAPDYGIHFNTTNNNHTGVKNFTNITIKDTGDDGIFINRSTNRLTMDTINITNSATDGITLSRSDRSTLTNLNINNNTLDGVVLFLTRRTTISNSVIDNNQDGIVMNRSRQNTVFDSTISNNSNRGIMLLTQNNNTTDEARNNVIRNNFITGNTNFGLRIFNNGTADNDNNQIYENCFNNPAGVNARDDETIGAPAANIFDLGGLGNFWDDDAVNSPGFSETCTDTTALIGICDTSYSIPLGGNSVDNNPTTSCMPVLATIDHYSIDFPVVPAVTCEGLEVDVEAHDLLDNIIQLPLNGTVLTLTANVATPADVVWQEGPGGNGSLVNGVPGAGQAQYTFNGTEGSVKFFMRYPNAETGVSVDVTDGTISDSNLSEDPSTDFVLAVFRFLDNTDADIGSQIAGKSSSVAPGAQTLQLRAVQTNTTTLDCEAALDGNGIAVDLAYQCNDPATCAITNNGASITAAAATTDIDDIGVGYTSINMDFSPAGVAEFSFIYNDAGDISLLAQKAIAADPLATPPTTAFTLQGTSTPFVVRPFGFDIDSGGQRASDWIESPGGLNGVTPGPGVNTSWAQDATGSAFAKAGNNFDLTIRAVVWESGDDSSPVDGIPDVGANLTDNALTPNFGNESTSELVDITHIKVRPTGAGTANGVLTGGDNLDFTGSGGTLTTALSWSEVGIIDLTAALDTTIDNEYLGGGSGVTSTHNNFGRFVPDRFTVSDNTPAFMDSCGGSFTYMDQEFYFTNAPELTITAVNEAGATTINYGGGTTGANGFWQLDPASLTRSYVNQATTAATFNESVVAGVTLSDHTDFDGIGLLTLGNTIGDRDIFEYQRASVDISANEGGEFTALVDLTISSSALSYTDGAFTICYDRNNDDTCDDYTHMTQAGAEDMSAALTGTDLRFGRLRIGTAVGSELLPLSVPFETQYYDDMTQSFMLNTLDGCTTIATTDLSLTSAIEVGEIDGDIDISTCAGGGIATATMANAPFVNGSGDLSFSVGPPAATCTGYIEIDLDLSMGGLDMEWLQYDWDDLDDMDDGPYDDNPDGRIDFGLFEGPSQYIYIREPW